MIEGSGSNLDPDNTLHSPYSEDRTPPPTLAELAKLSKIKPRDVKADEKAVQVTTQIPPEIAYAMDRILEKRIYRLKSRHDFGRLAYANLVTQCIDEVQQQHVRALVFRVNQMRSLLGELRQFDDIASMAATTKEVVRKFLNYANRMDAIRALRSAKRYSEEIPFEGIRERFVNYFYGSRDAGVTRAPESQWGEAEQLWHDVMEGDLDRDDEQEVMEAMKPYGS